MSYNDEEKRLLLKIVINLFVVIVTIITVWSAKFFVDKDGNEIEQPMFLQVLWWIGFTISCKIWIPLLGWLFNQWIQWKIAWRIAKWIDE